MLSYAPSTGRRFLEGYLILFNIKVFLQPFMRISQRKKSYCQNCHYPLTDNYNFCPHCGQENTEKLAAFSTLVYEFFSNLIAYDSRLTRTIRPFLFKPGFLTNEFIAGKRMMYMHPLRLYFIVSFFYFFAFTLAYRQDNNVDSFGDGENIAGSATQDRKANGVSAPNITTNPDSLVREKPEEVSIFNNTFTIDFLKDKRTTEAQVVDSMGWKQTLINRYIVRQAIKFARSDEKSIGTYFSEYMLDKASLLMFLMLPIFALLLKLIYLRRKRYYVEHLTFSLHIHSFAFLILLLLIVCERLFAADWFAKAAILLIFIYGAVAARNVYKQTWIKTLLKGILLFIPYTICFAIITTVAMVIAGLIY
jgi:hypothetical protein